MILSQSLPMGVFRLLESMTEIDDRFLAEIDELSDAQVVSLVSRYRNTVDRYKRTLTVMGACLSVATVAFWWLQKQRRVNAA